MNTAAVPLFNGMSREEVVKKWVTALRSGQYKQTQRVLRNSEGFCCLGVLCDLNAKMSGQPKWQGAEYLNNDLELPVELQEFILGDRGMASRLKMNRYAEMNDDGDKTFIELADIIERDLL